MASCRVWCFADSRSSVWQCSVLFPTASQKLRFWGSMRCQWAVSFLATEKVRRRSDGGETYGCPVCRCFFQRFPAFRQVVARYSTYPGSLFLGRGCCLLFKPTAPPLKCSSVARSTSGHVPTKPSAPTPNPRTITYYSSMYEVLPSTLGTIETHMSRYHGAESPSFLYLFFWERGAL